MNISEANEINALLRWVTRTTGSNGDVPTDERARQAATFLADRANRALAAGLNGATVLGHWPAARPAGGSELTEHDLDTLRKMVAANHGDCGPCCPCMGWKRDLADMLRADFPGLDDATLARVLLKTSGLISTYALIHRLTGTQAGGLIAGAAVELAALEIGDPTA